MVPPVKLSSRPTQEFWEIPVLFEDEHLFALDKPAGLSVSADPDAPERPSLVDLLHAGIRAGAPWAVARDLAYLAPAHRLDPDTSGVLLFAKSKPALVALANLFGSERLCEDFLALVSGRPPQEAFTVEAKLARHPYRPQFMQVDPRRGKKAATSFRIEERFDGYTLVRCQPIARRPHQVRVHLQIQGCPVIGDTFYDGQPLLLSRLKPVYRLKPDREERPLIPRVALHALSLSFAHPVTGVPIVIASPWPRDFVVSMKYLRRYASTALPPAAPPATEGAIE